MGRKVSRDRNQDVPALLGVAPRAEPAHARLKHLVGVKAGVFPEQRVRQRRDQRIRRVAKHKMARDQSAGHTTCR